MTDAEIIEVVTAHKEGKQIQWRNMYHARSVPELPWSDMDEAKWDFIVFEYRVKPEPRKPREFWIGQITPVGEPITRHWEICEYPTAGFMRVREVIEE